MKIEKEIRKRIERILFHLDRTHEDYVIYHIKKLYELVKKKKRVLED